LPHGIDLSPDRAGENQWQAALWNRCQASVRTAVLLGHYRQGRAVAADGRGHTECWVQTVQHDVGTHQQGARSAAEYWAGRQITVRPRAERHVKACLFEHGKVRDGQRGLIVLDEDSRTAPGSAR
jgi:hypothetical protein